MSHLTASKDQMILRVRRIIGQLQAVERALEADAPCAVTLHRVAAVRGAVGGLVDRIVEDHLRAHVAQPGLTDAERNAGAEEVLAAIRRYSK
jgi:DNA-binding FrmR family transcriptional regulator